MYNNNNNNNNNNNIYTRYVPESLACQTPKGVNCILTQKAS